MKVRELMSRPVIQIDAEESVAVAARTLEHYNIGMLPVSSDGKVCGILTDRDIVTRCLAANRSPATTSVGEIMTRRVLSVQPNMDAGVAAHLMGRQQVRRLPVIENGKLCGLLSLGDLASREESAYDSTDALSEITCNISER